MMTTAAAAADAEAEADKIIDMATTMRTMTIPLLPVLAARCCSRDGLQETCYRSYL